MNLTETQLKEIEELAGLFLSIDEIAIILDIDANKFAYEIGNRKGAVYKAYFKGKTETKRLIHENVVKLAKRGSPQAEEMAKQLILEQELSERRAKA